MHEEQTTGAEMRGRTGGDQHNQRHLLATETTCGLLEEEP